MDYDEDLDTSVGGDVDLVSTQYSSASNPLFTSTPTESSLPASSENNSEQNSEASGQLSAGIDLIVLWY